MRYALTLSGRTETGAHAVITETPAVTLYGALVAIGSAGEGIVAEADYRFETRYVDGVTRDQVGTMPVPSGVRRFHVQSAQDPDGLRRRLVIHLREMIRGAAAVA
jgi:hypothetical protein